MFSNVQPKFVWNAEQKRWTAIQANETKLARWAASFSPAGWNRLLRKQKLLGRPGITEAKLRKISELANVQNHFEFGRQIYGLILDAHRNDAASRGSTVENIKTSLNRVIRHANSLNDALRAIDIGSPGEYPGNLLERQLEKVHFQEQLILIPEFIELLDLLAAAASNAKPQKIKRGRGSNWAFDRFVMGLLMAVRQWRGHWSVHKIGKVYKGELLDALLILEPYLPPKFYPQKAALGRAVEHIRKKLNKIIAENPG
jgi:hypothetical protein